MNDSTFWSLMAEKEEVKFSESVIISDFLASRVDIEEDCIIKKRNFTLSSSDVKDLERLHKQELKTLLYYLENDVYIKYKEDLIYLLNIINKFKPFFIRFEKENEKLKNLEEKIKKNII